VALDAVVFDFDGTILDTESGELTAWLEEYARHDVPFDRVAWQASVGGSGGALDPAGDLAARVVGGIDVAATRDRQRARWLELVGEAQLVAGVEDRLDEAAELGLKLAVATSSGFRWAGEHLRRLGLLDRFGAVCTRDDVSRVKPDPELYTLACERLGVKPANAVAIEDSANGVRAANAAGLFTVAVPNPVTAGQDHGHADLRVSSLTELSLRELAARL
jgi:beta-phosphoglucomutase-like phosphatase (HAD superfamily)